MIMERYLNFVERYARAIVFLLVAITAYFTYTLGALISDTNPYLLRKATRRARPSSTCRVSSPAPSTR
jgi:hypothetical protein